MDYFNFQMLNQVCISGTWPNYFLMYKFFLYFAELSLRMFWNNFASIIIFLYTTTEILIVLHSFPFLFRNNTKLAMK